MWFGHSDDDLVDATYMYVRVCPHNLHTSRQCQGSVFLFGTMVLLAVPKAVLSCNIDINIRAALIP